MIKENEYRGITYPAFLSKFKWQKKLWKTLMCKRDIHIFDEVWTTPNEHHHNHYLSCDACELIVNIKSIDDTYTDTERDNC